MQRLLPFLVALAGLGALAASVQAQAPQFAMLDRLERGSWELTYRDDKTEKTKICLSGGRDLIQMRHARLNCNRVVVDDTPHEVTVQYSCPGNGYGRTNVRRETDRLVQIDTQGIERGLPFAFAAEARWVGPCIR